MEYRVTIYCKELCGSAFGATDWVQKKNIDLKKIMTLGFRHNENMVET